MPSSYACVFCSDVNKNHWVLLAFKRELARWMGWNGYEYMIPFSKPPRTHPHAVPYQIRNNPNQPVLPGGAVNNGETPQECAARELKEETGIVITDYKPVTTIKLFDNNNIETDNVNSYRFAGAYFELTKQDFSVFIKSAHENISNNNINEPNTVDDELADITYETVVKAAALFINAHVQNDPRQSTDWFSVILKNIPFT